ncbi:amino acid permease [Bifidobacterium choloepi]|uniref:Amino acid permease n=1 Tax=Bifidobacterium choloepi TaxID=2614131 RepID=A0A6I5N208_9BIFI|nr:amino acid permease [Bifidobacterium choloepi]NEG70195.1 amino acid permease [Bifidobacterium choloepi]
MSTTTKSGTKAVSASKAKEAVKGANSGTGYISTIALTMMTVTTLAGIANDVQLSFYGLSAVTYLLIGGILFFIPTGLVAAELASGWSQRGGIFRWVGEGLGTFPAICCLLILWFQTSFSFGSGIPGSSATIGFFTSDYNWAVNFAESDHSWKVTLPIMLGWLAYYWFICWLATKGVKVFSNIAKYGVIFGTFIPLAIMMILAVVWLCKGNRPAIDMSFSGFVPQWSGISTLSLAAGVFFSFAGVDMNAAHIKDLKHPSKQFPVVVFISMILAFLIFVIGTVIIAMIVPEGQINLLYTLDTVFRDLGAQIGFPDLYLVIVYLSLANSFAALITNLAGPSYMLGQAGRSGFLPKWLQNNNKHGMPSRMMYFQMLFMTIVAFVVFFLPNIEGFVALVTQAITILYMLYYVFMFVAFLRLRYTQPNRPRGFKVPGGKVGAWIVACVGIAASVFAIVLAMYPPAQLKAEVGSGFTYDVIIIAMIAFVFLCCVLLYRLSRKRNWVDPTNQFAPFTWQIEGMKKPGKALSNIPTAIMSEDQDPMGMPIKHTYTPDEMISLPSSATPEQQAEAAADLLRQKGIVEPDTPEAGPILVNSEASTKAVQFDTPNNGVPVDGADGTTKLPTPTAEQVGATALPDNPSAAADIARARAKAAAAESRDASAEVKAYNAEAKADDALAEAEGNARTATATANLARASVMKDMSDLADGKAPASDGTPTIMSDESSKTTTKPAVPNASAVSSDATATGKPAADGTAAKQ